MDISLIYIELVELMEIYSKICWGIMTFGSFLGFGFLKFDIGASTHYPLIVGCVVGLYRY